MTFFLKRTRRTAPWTLEDPCEHPLDVLIFVLYPFPLRCNTTEPQDQYTALVGGKASALSVNLA